MIWDVSDDFVVPLNPKPQRGSNMRNIPCSDLKPAKRESFITHTFIGDRGGQRIQFDWEYWWSHSASHCFSDIHSFLQWCDYVHLCRVMKKWREKWEALNVVPMQMRQQDIDMHWHTVRKRAGKIPKTCS